MFNVCVCLIVFIFVCVHMNLWGDGVMWACEYRYLLYESAQSNGALSNGFNADSGVQPKDLTVIAFSAEAIELVPGKKEQILNKSF